MHGACPQAAAAFDRQQYDRLHGRHCFVLRADPRHVGSRAALALAGGRVTNNDRPISSVIRLTPISVPWRAIALCCPCGSGHGRCCNPCNAGASIPASISFVWASPALLADSFFLGLNAALHPKVTLEKLAMIRARLSVRARPADLIFGLKSKDMEFRYGFCRKIVRGPDNARRRLLCAEPVGDPSALIGPCTNDDCKRTIVRKGNPKNGSSSV